MNFLGLAYLNLFFWLISLFFGLLFNSLKSHQVLIVCLAICVNLILCIRHRNSKLASKVETMEQSKRKQAVMNDLDEELERRKKENVFLRN